MNGLVSYLEVLQEIEEDKIALRKHGLTEEEIQGYIEFYLETFFPEQKGLTS